MVIPRMINFTQSTVAGEFGLNHLAVESRAGDN